MYTQLLSSNPCTSGSVHEDKYFWSFPHSSTNNLTLGLPYAWRMLGLNPPLPIWRAIYWASWMNWRRRILESKETIVHCCITCLCLSLHPFVPLEHTLLLFPSLPLLCKLAMEMEDWSGGFDKVCHYPISIFINRNIHFSSNTCAQLWIFCPWM